MQAALGRLGACSAVIGLLQACSLTPTRPIIAPPQGPARPLLSLPLPPGYPGELAAVQQLDAVRGERGYALEVLLRLSAARVVVVLALPFGPRLATIDWSANGVQVRRDMDLPDVDRISPEAVLIDLVVAFWPEDAVRASLSEGISLEVGPEGRRVLRAGVPVIEVRRDGDDPWNDDTEVVDHRHGYRLSIASRTVPSA